MTTADINGITTDMKQILIGVFPLYALNVNLYAWPESKGGRLSTRPSASGVPAIHVGFNYPQWEDVVSILLHESFEFCATLMELQFSPASQQIFDSSAQLFVFNHAQFTRVCEFQAQFVTRCLPALAAAYKKHHKK